MRNAEGREREAQENKKNQLAMALSQSVGAGRMGQGPFDPQKMAMALTQSGIPELAGPGVAALLKESSQPKAPTIKEIGLGTDPKTGKPLYVSAQWDGSSWVPMGTSYTKGAQTEISNVVTTGQQPATPMQKKVDEKFAETYSDFVLSGGFADVEKQISQLGAVAEKLQNSDSLTGWAVGNTPDWILSIVNPGAISAREDVEEVVQRNLRLILGPQFTEKEGERLIGRAYNPKLDESTNAKRLSRLMRQMQLAAEAKREAALYYQQNGTLQGYSGKIWTIDDFSFDSVGGGDFSQMSDDELRAIINGER